MIMLMSAERQDSEFFRKHKKSVVAGAVVASAVVGVAAAVWLNQDSAPPPKPKNVGAVDNLLWIPAPEYIKYNAASETIGGARVSFIEGVPGAGDDPEKWEDVAILSIPKASLQG